MRCLKLGYLRNKEKPKLKTYFWNLDRCSLLAAKNARAFRVVHIHYRRDFSLFFRPPSLIFPALFTRLYPDFTAPLLALIRISSISENPNISRSTLENSNITSLVQPENHQSLHRLKIRKTTNISISDLMQKRANNDKL